MWHRAFLWWRLWERGKHLKNFLYQWLLFYLPQGFCKSPTLMQKARPSPFLNRSLLPQLALEASPRGVGVTSWGLNPTHLLAQGPLVKLTKSQFPYLVICRMGIIVAIHKAVFGKKWVKTWDIFIKRSMSKEMVIMVAFAGLIISHRIVLPYPKILK